MENEVKIFNSTQFGVVRTAGDAENPQFCLSDLCKALGLSVKGVKQRLSKEVISTYPLETAGGKQKAIFVNEDGLYDVIIDSRKPEARAFRKWITGEVLPSIRKSGKYEVAKLDFGDEELMRNERSLDFIASKIMREDAAMKTIFNLRNDISRMEDDFGYALYLLYSEPSQRKEMDDDVMKKVEQVMNNTVRVMTKVLTETCSDMMAAEVERYFNNGFYNEKAKKLLFERYIVNS